MEKKICLSCGYENDSNKKFCVSCGKKLEEQEFEVKFCPECGEKLDEDSVFCAGCGKKVSDLMNSENSISEEESISEDNSEEEVEYVFFCPECGEEIEEDSVFCANCGAKLDFDVQDEFVEDDHEESEDEEVVDEDETIEEDIKQEEIDDSEEEEPDDSNEKLEEEQTEEEKYFCPECGEELEKDSVFCVSCGAKLSSSDEKDSVEEKKIEESGDEEVADEDETTEEEQDLEEDIKQEEIDDSEEEESDDSNEKLEEEQTEEEKYFCPECGEELEKDSVFCVSCGAKLSSSDVEDSVEENEVEDIKQEEIKASSLYKENQVLTQKDNVEENDSKKKKILILLLILLLLIIGAVVVVWKPWQKVKDNKEKQEEVLVTVPSVVDKTGKEAIEILEGLSLEVEFIEEETEDSDKVGIVFEQDIVNKKVKKNSTVVIKVYVSKEKIEMVPVIGDTLEEAQKKLNNLGVTTKVVEETSNTVEKGKIISQSTPEGETVSKGGTVTIVVSTGKEDKKENPENPTPTPKSTKTPESSSKPTPKSTPSEKTPEPTKRPTEKPKSWSNWITSLPSNVTNNKYDIETKTQYRSRTKETKTSTSSSLSGWIKYDTKTEPIYSETKTAEVNTSNYDSFKRNTNYQILSEEVTNVDITYLYCKKGGNSSSSSSQWISYKKIGNDKTCADGYSVIDVKEMKQPGNTSMIGTYIKRNVGSLSLSVLVSNATPSNWKITYKEKNGDKTTYYFYRYGSWGSWQDTSINSNDSVQVETRTMYRYREK